MNNLSNIIEAILFVSGDSVAVNDIAEKLGVTEEDISSAVEELKAKYDENSGIKLLSFNGKLQFASNSQYGESVSAVLNPIKERNLTRAVLEVVAIIAYKQPITRLDLENIRGGVNSDYALSILLENGLIEVVGRKDAIGKPLLFGTTDKFLKRFNLSDISDLPDYEELLERIKVIHQPKEELFNYTDYSTGEGEKVNEDNTDESEQIRIYNEMTEALKNIKVPDVTIDEGDEF